MGTFIQTMLLLNCSESTVKTAMKKMQILFDGEIIADDCSYQCQNNGIQMQLYSPYCFEYDELARTISEEVQQPVMFLYIYDSEYWGYYFYENGKEQDRFNPMPDYFRDCSELEQQRQRGNVELIAQYFNIAAETIKKYLVPWTLERIAHYDEKAYPDDLFGQCDCWQMTDFMRKLGFCYDLEPEGIEAVKREPLPTIDEILLRTRRIKLNPEKEIYTIGQLPNALDTDYIQSILQEDTSEILRYLGSWNPQIALWMLNDKIDPKQPDPVLYTLSAFCHYWLSSPIPAFWDLYRALDYDPDNIMLLRARTLMVALNSKRHIHIKDLTKLLKLDPDNSDMYLLLRAFFSFQDRACSALKLDDAYADLEQLIYDGFPAENDPRIRLDEFPQDFQQFVADTRRRAEENTLANRKKAIEGLSALDDIWELKQEDYQTIFDLLQKEDYKNAIAECTKEIKHTPADHTLYLLRAYCYHHYKSWISTPKKITDDLNAALLYAPNNLIARRARAFMLHYANMDTCQQQIADLTQLLEMDPAYSNTYLAHRSFIYYDMRDFAHSLLDVETLIKQHIPVANELLSFIKEKISTEELLQIIDKHNLCFVKAQLFTEKQ